MQKCRHTKSFSKYKAHNFNRSCHDGLLSKTVCSRRVAERAVSRCLGNLADVCLLLALNAKRRPRDSMQPLRMDLFFALLAHPEGAFAYAAQSRARAAKLLRVAVDMRDRESTFGRTLNFVNLIGAWPHRDRVAYAGRVLEFGDPRLQKRLESIQLISRRCLCHASLYAIHSPSSAVLHVTENNARLHEMRRRALFK